MILIFLIREKIRTKCFIDCCFSYSLHPQQMRKYYSKNLIFKMTTTWHFPTALQTLFLLFFFHFAKDCNSNWEKCWNATRNSNFVIFMMQTDAFHYCVFRFFSLFIVLLQCYGPLLSNFLYIRIIVSNSTTKFYKIISICIYTPAIV